MARPALLSPAKLAASSSPLRSCSTSYSSVKVGCNISPKGSYINDVCTPRGGSSKSGGGMNLIEWISSKCRQERRGSKIRKCCRCHLRMAPNVLLRRLGRLINPFAAPLSAVIDICFPSSNAFFRPETERERAAAPFPHSSRGARPTG